MKPQGPDFLVIGAQRSGTSWLYLVLRRHPALWLPPVKEIHYFDKLNGDPKRWRRAWNARSSFLNWWTLGYLFGQRSDDWYAKLFTRAQAAGRLAGEITPAYATLDEDMFRRIQRMNEDIRLAFIMRDPVERAWSAVTNAFKKNPQFGALTLENALARARSSDFAARSAYTDTIARLETVFSAAQLHLCFHDDLRERPEILVANLLRFLGVDPRPARDLLLPKFNSSSGRSPMPPEFEREMAKAYLPMVQRLCQRFDGPPQRWLARYERLLASDVTPAPAVT